MTTITRADVLRRAHTIWPLGSVPYSQERLHAPDGYREDCSGWVCACWGVPLDAPGSWGGLNTVNMVTDHWMSEIDPNDLRPGDAVGLCGPGTGGNDGHVQLFTGWYNQDPHDSRYYLGEQTGGGSGPHFRLSEWVHGYKAYRYRNILDDAPAPASSFPLRYPPNVYGTVTGPDWCHGGYYAAERPAVQRIQQRLQELGFAPATPGWADGIFDVLGRPADRPTTLAVIAFQRAHGLEPDGLVGPKTWAALGL